MYSQSYSIDQALVSSQVLSLMLYFQQDTGSLVQFVFQRDSEQFFATSMSHAYSAADLLAFKLFLPLAVERKKKLKQCQFGQLT